MSIKLGVALKEAMELEKKWRINLKSNHFRLSASTEYLEECQRQINENPVDVNDLSQLKVLRIPLRGNQKVEQERGRADGQSDSQRGTSDNHKSKPTITYEGLQY